MAPAAPMMPPQMTRPQPPGAPGAAPPKVGAGGPGVVGGPSGPGSSPMVSPGNGAGMQARALARTKQTIESLMEDAQSFEPGTPQFNAYMGAIRTLNGVFKGAGQEHQPAPLPVPATQPGAGLGGVGAPPAGGPATGAPPTGAGPAEPGVTGGIGV